MTASKPNLRVLAVGNDGIADWLLARQQAPHEGTPALAVMPNDDVPGFQVGREFDLCTPGFVSGVARALVTAGIRQAGGPGVQALHRRALNLSQAVQSIGRVLKEAATDGAGLQAADKWDECRQCLALALEAIGEVVESCALDVCGVEPGKAARAVLAAHGWRESTPGTWLHENGLGHFSVTDGGWKPAELFAFATLAEESRP